jgi:hypothetical protein
MITFKLSLNSINADRKKQRYQFITESDGTLSNEVGAAPRNEHT